MEHIIKGKRILTTLFDGLKEMRRGRKKLILTDVIKRRGYRLGEKQL